MDVVNKYSDSYSEYDEDVAQAGDTKTFLGMRISAIIEMLGLLVGLWIIDALVCDGSGFYTYQLPLNPFLIGILLLTLQYGSLVGLTMAILSIIVFFIGNTALSVSDLVQIEVAIIPVFWLATAGFLGMIRDRHVRERARFQSKLHDSTSREKVTAEAYQEVRSRKERLEERVAGEMRSALTVYQSAKSLENMAPNHLMRALENMIRDLLGAQTFSLFLMDNNALDASITSNWQGEYASLPRRYTSSSTIYQRVVGGRELLTVANSDHENILNGEGVLAAPVVTSSGEVLGMIKIESLPFSKFGLHTVETLRLISEWAASALNNARHYQSALNMAVENPSNHLYTSSYFDRFTGYITALGKRVKFPVSMVSVGLTLPEDTTQSEEIKVGRIISEAVQATLRSVDLAFDYKQDGSQYTLILPNTDRQGAEIVREKVATSVDQKLRAQGVRYPFTTTVQELAA